MIFCTKCGHPAQDDTKFCSKCGTLRTVDINPDYVKKTAPKGITSSKIIVAFVVIAVLAVSLLVIKNLIGHKESRKFPKLENSIIAYSNNGSIVVVTSEDKEWLYDGNNFTMLDSLDGAQATILVSDDPDNVDYSGGTLYLVSDAENILVAEHVFSNTISTDGQTVVYTSQNEDSKSFVLNLYQNGNRVNIAEKVLTEYITVSPDGKAVAYVDSNEETWVWDGKYTSVGNGYIPIAMSLGGEYIYLVKEQNNKSALYVFNENELKRLSAELESLPSISLNRSGSEIVYTDMNKNSYISVDGDDGIKLGTINYILMPQDSQAIFRWHSRSDGYLSSYFLLQYGIDTFKNTLAVNRDDSRSSIVEIDEEFAISTIINSCLNCFLCDDEHTLIYSDSNAVCKLDINNKSSEPEILAVKHTDDISVSSDGKTIYYIVSNLVEDKKDYMIFHIGADNESTLVADNVYLHQINPLTGTIYYLVEDGIYRFEKDLGKSEITGLDSNNIFAIGVNMFYVTLEGKNERGDILAYYSTDDKTFKLVDFTLRD